MKKCRLINLIYTFVIALMLVLIPAPAEATDDYGEFPQENAWTQATPSVIWADFKSTTTLEVHIVGREDVNRVWVTDIAYSEPEGLKELFDDGTHGDKVSGDDVFTVADVLVYNEVPDVGYGNWGGFLRVELDDGTRLGNNYPISIGLVDPKYKDTFPVQDFGNGLSATPYAFFIQDSDHEVIDNYPVSTVYCGTENYEAYKKLYSVFPDVFDFASLMPGMQVFRPKDLGENVPYHVTVSNNIKNIGLPMTDDTEKFGSAGRLKSAVYHSFGGIDIMDHELGHTWGVAIGEKLGLMNKKDGEDVGHWNGMADMQGQMGYYYYEGDYYDGIPAGHFAYNEDGTWRIIPNTAVEPYSPLELYVMGLIPSSEVPDVHILKNPDFTDPKHITAKSFKTITAEQLVKSAGGERIPSSVDSQKEFNMAFIVTQDMPYNDAAYAYFSLMSKELMSQDPPRKRSYLAPFYWATGGRATLNTYLGDYGVLELPAPTPAQEPTESPAPEPSSIETPPPVTESPTPEAVMPVQGTGGLSSPVLLIIGVLVVAVAVLLTILMKKRKSK